MIQAPDLDRLLTPQTLVLSVSLRQKLRDTADKQGENISELARRIFYEYFNRLG